MQDYFIRINELADSLGVCRATVYNMINRGDLPPTAKISTNCAGWYRSRLEPYLKPLGYTVPSESRNTPHSNNTVRISSK